MASGMDPQSVQPLCPPVSNRAQVGLEITIIRATAREPMCFYWHTTDPSPSDRYAANACSGWSSSARSPNVASAFMVGVARPADAGRWRIGSNAQGGGRVSARKPIWGGYVAGSAARAGRRPKLVRALSGPNVDQPRPRQGRSEGRSPTCLSNGRSRRAGTRPDAVGDHERARGRRRNYGPTTDHDGRTQRT
jgi:hypothetical protein